MTYYYSQFANAAGGYTDASGGFNITGLAAGSYMLRIEDANRGVTYEDEYTDSTAAGGLTPIRPATLQITVAAGQHVDVGELILTKSRQISGAVTVGGAPATASGHTEVQVQVLYQLAGSTDWTPADTTTTDASGNYLLHLPRLTGDLPVGRYRIFAEEADAGTGFVPITQDYDDLTSPLNLDLQFGSDVTGYVFDGKGVDNNEVNITLTSGSRTITAQPIAGGTFDIRNVPPGDWTLTAAYVSGFASSVTRTFTVTNANVVVPQIDLTPLPTIRGVVEGADTGYLAGIIMYAFEYDSSTGGYVRTISTTTDRNGFYQFMDVPLDDYGVEAFDSTGRFATMEYDNESPYYQPDLVEASSTNFFEAEFTMPLANRIQGTVYGVSVADLGAGDVEAEVEVFDGASGGWYPTGDLWPVDSAGSYDIGDLPPDSYRISVSYSGLSGQAHVTTPTIDVSGGQTSAGNDVTMPAPTGQLPSGSPRGSLDRTSVGLGSISLGGWAFDPDTHNSIPVHLYVDGYFVAQIEADQVRPDIGAAYPGYGSEHGYSVTLIDVPAGPHSLCAYAINAGPVAGNTTLGCRKVTVAPTSPVGSLDSVALNVPGSVSVSGWALDVDATTLLAVHVYVDGAFYSVLSTTGDRPDVGDAYPGTGTTHGYSTTLGGLKAGTHSICTYAINQGSGSNALLGCRTVTVLGGSPFGSVDSATVSGLGTVAISGWALDGDTTASISVQAYVNGVYSAQLTADGARPDIAGAFPGYGASHGFSGTLSGLQGGTNTVCLYGINQLAGSNSTLGCKTVTLPTGSPFGSVDSVTGSGAGIAINGWALDPDVAASIDVHVYIDNKFNSVVTASGTRSDIASAFPGYGSAHGFSTTVTASAGSHTVCVYGINQGVTANNSVIGGRCSTVVVPAG